MFTHLKIGPIRGLTSCTLTRLGKINIICGRNNSGKSTLLDGINSKGIRYFGVQFTEDNLARFYTESWMPILGNGAEEQNKSAYLTLLKATISDDKIWYTDESQSFADQVNKLAPRYFGGRILSERELMGRYQLFIESPATAKVALLPPKRQLQLGIRVSTGEEITATGLGLLNYLFYAKNQSPGSDEHRIYNTISQTFYDLSSGYKFDVVINQSNDLSLLISYENQAWIPAEACGLGLQDLIVILYFAIHPEYQVVLIEEPESHLHPDLQRKLLVFLRDQTDKQYFLTTHSNVFLNNTLVDRVFFTRLENGAIQVADATARAAILNDLGYEVTDNLVSDLVILVEGPSDTPLIEKFLVEQGLLGSYNIKIWPLGGDIMDEIDLSVLLGSYKAIALIDGDPGSAKVRRSFIARCKPLGVEVHQLERYAIENYFPLHALRAVFSTQIPAAVTTIDPHKKLEEQIGLNVKKRTRKIAEVMTWNDIENTDLGEFFGKVAALCEA